MVEERRAQAERRMAVVRKMVAKRVHRRRKGVLDRAEVVRERGQEDTRSSRKVSSSTVKVERQEEAVARSAVPRITGRMSVLTAPLVFRCSNSGPMSS